MRIALFIISIVFFSIGCTPKAMKKFARTVTGHNSQSMVMVGESKSLVRRLILDFKAECGENFTFIDNGDTLGYSAQIEALPINAIFIFKDDINIYQELDVYCSPCADEMISFVLKDTRYNFKASDEVNYISTTEVNAIMRLREPEENDQSCHQMRVYLK